MGWKCYKMTILVPLKLTINSWMSNKNGKMTQKSLINYKNYRIMYKMISNKTIMSKFRHKTNKNLMDFKILAVFKI